MRHTGTQPLETERLALRRFTPDDADAAFTTWAGDADIAAHMSWTADLTAQATYARLLRWCAAYDQPDCYRWAITSKKTGALLGYAGVFRNCGPHGSEVWEPGICLGRAHWRQGYATEAVNAVVAYFMAETGADTLYCLHLVDNAAAEALLARLGFRFYRAATCTLAGGRSLPAKSYILHKT